MNEPASISDGFSLHPAHCEDLKASGLDDATIETMQVRSLRPADINRLAAAGGLPGVESALVYPYFGVNGFCRYKLFPPLKNKDGHNIKYFQLKGTGCHLYILPRVLEKIADLSTPLFFIEGEKKAAAAVQAGLCAIGIGGLWNWVNSETGEGIDELDRIAFADRDVGLIPDSDVWMRSDLQKAVYAFGMDLQKRGANVSIYLIPQPGKEKIGFDDFLLNHIVEDFRQLKTINLKHPTLMQHRAWWDEWKKKKEAKKNNDVTQGQAIALTDPEPCPDAVDGVKLLDDIAAAFHRFVVLPPHADVVQGLWCVHAHALDALGISPVLEITSPDLECGKSVNQSVIRRMTPRALTTTSISMSGIFRTVEKYKPTLFVDEGDAFLALNEDLRGILNSSHLRNDAFVIRVVGDDHEPRTFSTWCAKSIALIGNLPPTLRSRSITIQMKRKTGKDKVEDFHGHYPYPELETLKRQAWRWTRDNLAAIKDARPQIPDGLINRAKDNWSPLFTIAEVAGGEWPKRCREAALAFQKSKPDETSAGVMLLVDLQDLFRESEGESLPTEEILAQLMKLDERPWGEWKKGKPMTAVQLARLLKPFGIRPKTIRVGEGTPKGYDLDDCQDAFARYIPPEPDSEPPHPQQTNNLNDLNPMFEPQQRCNVADEREKVSSRNERHVADVAGRNMEDGEGWEDAPR